ncbi:recombinase family protein [Ruminiclostridium cellobioparum]|uniref:recombinase family protein n=1 Tax=Ruminiclostridium cellobioparum TaxID=29355 RepID=UPI0009FBED52|nr:recombinase family protein [Ruminiclostridium cellobioparum]
MIKGATYNRYSPGPDQTDDSIEAQLTDNRAYAVKNKIDIIKDYIDEERSGKSDNRADFQRMIEDAKKGLFEVIICHKIDRFARNRYDSAIYKAQLKRLGIKVLYSAQNISDSPEGRLMEGVLESFAEYFSDNLATEVMKGLKTTARKGEFTGGFAPLGYDIVDKKYVINDYEASIVKKIFDMYAGGATYGKILSELKSKGFKTKFNADFGKNSLYSILENKKYIGIMEYNKAIPRVPGRRNGHKTKPEDQIITVENIIPPIIDLNTWKLTSARKIDNKHSRAQFKAIDTYLLTGLVCCETCNTTMAGHRTKNNQQRIYSYYLCKNCRNKVRKEHIEQKTLAVMVNKIFSDDSIDKYVEKLNKYSASKFNKAESEINKLRSTISRLDKEINNIVNVIMKGISSTALEEKLQTLEQAKKDSLYELACVKSDQIAKLYSPDELKSNLSKYKEILERGDIDECKPIVKQFIQKITKAENDKITFDYCLDTIGADEET